MSFMTLQQEFTEVVQVPCKACLKEIPKSVAAVFEAADYVHYFCGLECYAIWREQAVADIHESDWDTLP